MLIQADAAQLKEENIKESSKKQYPLMARSRQLKGNKHAERHGQWQTDTYHTWEGMKQRCLNPKATRYPQYGGVGIKICDSWLKFKNFYKDMGDRPKGKTLDRIDPFGNYEPSNCRWATRKEQQNNQRRHKTGREGLC